MQRYRGAFHRILNRSQPDLNHLDSSFAKPCPQKTIRGLCLEKALRRKQGKDPVKEKRKQKEYYIKEINLKPLKSNGWEKYWVKRTSIQATKRETDLRRTDYASLHKKHSQNEHST